MRLWTFFFNDTATTEIYTLSLHDALPIWTLGDGYALVHPAHRQHAHRTARPVHQLDLVRQEVLYAVAVDGVGVAPADLHELVVAVGVGDRGDLRRHGPRQLGVPELAYVSQWGLPSVGSTLRMTPSLLSTALRAL